MFAQYQKKIAVFVIISQLAMPFAFASSDTAAAPQGVDAETNYLLTVNQVTGEKMSQEEMANALADAYTQYDQTAPKAGRADRLENAMVSFGLVTSQQIGEINNQLQASNEAFAHATSDAERTQISSAMVQNLVLTGKGAQFAGAEFMCGFGLFVGLSGFLGLLGAAADSGTGNASISNQAAKFAIGGGTLIGVGAIVSLIGCSHNG